MPIHVPAMFVYGIIVMGRFALAVDKLRARQAESRINAQYLITYYDIEVKFYP